MTSSTHTRRRFLWSAAIAVPVLGGAAMIPAISKALAGPTDHVTLPDFSKPGDIDDSDALHRALASGKPVYAPAGKGKGPGGRYLVASTPEQGLPSGAHIFGDGIGKTILARSYARPAAFILYSNSGSADAAKNVTGLTLRDLSFEDEVERRGFSEYEYSVMLNGSTRVLIERVGFRGFRGDGLHLGSGTSLGDERHNRDVTVRNCVFDGINANNRNAISIIDCDGLLIEDSQFLNCSRYGDGSANAGDPMNPRTGLMMPGAIDFEPNSNDFAIVRRATIRRNRFTGGGGYAVALNLSPNSLVKIPQEDFLISDNVIEGRTGGLVTAGYGGDDATGAAIPYNVRFVDNVVRTCRWPFLLNGLRGVKLERNTFQDCQTHAEINNNASNALVELTGNVFDRVGTGDGGFGLWIRANDRVTLTANQFIDSGLPNEKAGTAIGLVGGRIRNLAFHDNSFTSPAGRMANPMIVFAGAQVDRLTLRESGSRQSVGGPSLRTALKLD